MTRYALTGTPYISTSEIAAHEGLAKASVRSELRAGRNRKTDPVDFRVPDHLVPDDLRGGERLYWRADAEEWMQDRAERRQARAAKKLRGAS